MSLLPLTFFTALMAFVLISGQGTAARAGRLLGLLVALACLGLWAYGFFTYEAGEGPLAAAIDDFYATSYLRETLGAFWAGAATLLLASGPVIFAVWEFWRRR